MSDYSPTERTRLRLYHELGSYDRDLVHGIIDEAPMCHISAVVDGSPYIQATVHWREGEKVLVHGGTGGVGRCCRSMRTRTCASN